MSRSFLLGLSALALGAMSCGPPSMTQDASVEPVPPTYANVADIFMRSCSFTSCHGGAGAGAARLNFRTAIANGTLISELVGAPACQYGLMPLVSPGDPDGSWLWYKLDGPHTGRVIDFTPDPSWDHGGLRPNMTTGLYPSSTCPLTSHGVITFGAVMPSGTTAMLRPDQRETIRQWILAGAPGPELPDGGVGDAGHDAGASDAGALDAGDGGGIDAGDAGAIDAGDTGPDAGVDAGDAGPDTGADAGSGAGSDAGTDAGTDAGVDAG